MSWLAVTKQPRLRDARAWLFDVGVLIPPTLLALPYLLRSETAPHPRWLAAVAVALLVVPLLWRRLWPVPVFAAIVAVAVAFGGWDISLVGNLSLPIALYSVASYGTRRQTFWCTAVLEVLVVIAAARIAGTGMLAPAVYFTGMVAAATGLGLYTATRRAFIQELIARTKRLEREQAQAQHLAAADERARIAREMHDIVAHHLTVMVALSDASARLVASEPQRASETLRTLSGVGRNALHDTRNLLGVLSCGGESDERQPLPSVKGLDLLIDQVRAAGLSVDYSVQGSPPQLPAELHLAIYRIVQESLTNTMKHAPSGTHATVSLRYLEDGVGLCVDDDAAGERPSVQPVPGRGTHGMTARVQALGGRVVSYPRRPTGWRVEAHLPGASRAEEPVGVGHPG